MCYITHTLNSNTINLYRNINNVKSIVIIMPVMIETIWNVNTYTHMCVNRIKCKICIII